MVEKAKRLGKGILNNKSKLFLFLSSGVALASAVGIGVWAYMTFHTKDLLGNVQGKDVIGVAVGEDEDKKEFPFVEVDFDPLKERNEDITAWLKLDAIGLDIPIVQSGDNEFYLNHDVDKKSNKLGWVFADVRSNMEYMSTNTVLYGHNAASQQMFGSLKHLYNIDKEKVEQDGIIQLTTPKSEQVYEITSVYVTTYDDWKYVQQVFKGDEDKQEFINRMVEKNEVKMFEKDNLSTDDRFLTFSTCYGPAGTTKRLVVHARLVAERFTDNPIETASL